MKGNTMSYFDTDGDGYFDVPAGYRDADIEMAELEAAARYHSHMRKIGKCTHTWVQGLGANGEWYGEGPAPATGHVLCLHCDQIVPDPFG
jgi:hypothetical protein